MKTVKVKNLVIGDGIPKICVPIIGRSDEEIIQQAEKLLDFPVDLIEIRIDYYDKCLDVVAVKNIVGKIKQIIQMPLIFTLRTAQEGGELDISKEEYQIFLESMIATGLIDIIDIELFKGDFIVKDIVKFAHKSGVKVILSNHDFNKTPIKFEIVARLVKMQSLNADIAKIAVMPSSVDDLLTLLSATNEVNCQFGEIPIVTMSMGKTGLLSRLTGQIFGSAITFGAVGQTSAPGQFDVLELKSILEIINRNIL